MPTVEHFLDICEAVSRKDWGAFIDVAEAVAEFERKKKHFGAAAQIREAAALVVARNVKAEEIILSDQSSSAPPFDLVRKSDSEIPDLSVPQWLQKELDSLFLEWKFKDKLEREGIIPRNTILLHGPPGCGKTALAQYIAGHLNREIYTVRFDALISSYLGETGSNIRKIFEFAKINRCILFLDEIDAIAKLRDDSSELGELKRVVIALLQNIDTLSNETILIAATNHPHMLDQAIWRRFDIVWEMLPPKDDIRIKFFESDFNDFACNPELRECILNVTRGMTGAELKRTINECKRKLILDANLVAAEAYLLAIVDHVRRGERGGSLDKSNNVLSEALLSLRKLNRKKYTYAKLEELTGISHSTLHHKANKSNGR